jgi:hypothetical protein
VGVGGVKKFEEIFEKIELDPTPQTPSKAFYTAFQGVPRHKRALKTLITTKSL